MADTKTSAEISAGTLTGNELIRVVQGGADRKTTLNAIVADLGLTGGGGTGGAPTNAEYIVNSGSTGLTNELVFTNNTVIEKDVSVAGQISYTLVDNGIATSKLALNCVGNARMAKMAANTFKCNNTAALADPVDMAVAASQLVGRGSTGNLSAITLGTNLTMSGTTLNAAGTGGGGTFGTTEIQTWKLVRTDANGFLIDELDNIISGTPAVTDYAALVALVASDYDGYAVNIQTGSNNSFWASNGTSWGPVNGEYVHERSVSPSNTYIFPDNVTWTASNNGSAKVRLTTGGGAAHNMVSANAVGSYLYLISGGAGWTAATSHQITAVTATTVDLATNFTSGMGVPVFAKAGTVEASSELPLLSIELPVLRSNTSVIIECTIEYSSDVSTGARRAKCYLETTELTNNNVTATLTTNVPYRFGFYNQANTAIQRGMFGSNGNGYAFCTLPPADAAVNTGIAGRVITIRSMCNVPGITARVGAYELIIRS